MDNEQYAEKVKKLLALAESPNEAEAKAALLKAQAMIAKYKIEAAQLGEEQEDQVVTLATGISFNSRTKWKSSVATILAEHMGCFSALEHQRGSRTYFVLIVGLKGDAVIAVEALRFAVGFVDGHIAEMKRQLMKDFPGTRYRRYRDDVCLSYGFGFASGLDTALHEQEEQNEWGLVMVMPEVVQEEMERGYTTARVARNSTYVHRENAYNQGFEDGAKYNAFGEKPTLHD